MSSFINHHRYHRRVSSSSSTTTGVVTVAASSSSTTTNNTTNNTRNNIPTTFGGSLGDIMSPLNTSGNANNGLFRDGLITQATQSLAATYGITNPLDRMAITANGNLQRLFSSYYDAPVSIHVEYCRQIQQQQQQQQTSSQQLQQLSSQFLSKFVPINNNNDTDSITAGIWERRVTLRLYNDPDKTFCTADSIVIVHDTTVEQLIESGTVGIGQLFRQFNVLPEFALLDAGLNNINNNNLNNNPNNNNNSEDEVGDGGGVGGGGFWRYYTLTSDNLVTCYIHEVFSDNVWNLL
ncbi:hypothetical protein IV203_025062 [Nitzschia inconspicua]|nr:hypothetical protein IV203_025062 [Nitzschia inconspicua]